MASWHPRRRVTVDQAAPRRLGDGSRRVGVALASIAVMFGAVLSSAAPAAHANTVASDQTQLAQLQAQIADEGSAIQQLVAQSNQAQIHLTALQGDLVAQERQVHSDQVASASAAARLRAVALYEYVNGSRSLATSVSQVPSLAAKAEAAMIESEYVSAAGVNVSDAIHAYAQDQKLVSSAEAHTKALAGAETKALSSLNADRAAAQQALNAEETTLSQVKGNLAVLLAAAQARQTAAQQASEAALAAQANAAAQQVAAVQIRASAPATTSAPPVNPPVEVPPQNSQPQSPPQENVAPPNTSAQSVASRPVSTPTPVPTEPPTPITAAPVTTYPPVTAPVLQLVQAPAPVVPSPGTYANPLRAVSNLYPERVDQGVDYSGIGPIYAIGDGVVLSVTNSGWPGATFIAYRLTDGPAAGLTVYAAEDILPSVTLGESVTASTVLGTMFEGPDGVETGWASYAGTGATMAYGAGQFNGSNSTAFGYNFSLLLASLGAPAGVLQNSPATGDLPPGWPQW